jgi:hypothetical protein
MKRPALLLALMLVSALPAFSQSSDFGVIVGGSRRFVDNAPREDDSLLLDSNFAFSNSVVDLYWAMAMGEDTRFKIKAGRIESEIADAYTVEGDDTVFRRDVEGEVQHIDALIEYRFTEPYGATGLFAGVGLYRQSGEGIESKQNFGWSAGLNADFPLSRRYGVVLEGTYHWTRGDFRPRYVTLGGGLRISF